jgi:hypothetical protein
VIEISVGTYSRARFWIGELPDAEVTPEDWLVGSAIEVGTGLRATSVIAIELMLVREPLFPYGLLGGTFTPNGNGRLQVEVVVGSRQGEAPPWILPVPHQEEVRRGIARSNAQSAFDAIDGYEAAHRRLGSGVLRVTHALDSPQFSSPRVFRTIGRALADLASRPSTDPGILRSIFDDASISS